jgi:flagellar assembly protein FliH
MPLSQPVKFTFERRFGERRANPFSYGGEERKVALAAHEAAVKQAEEAAFAAGRAQGAEEARTEETARLARALAVLGEHVDILARDLGEVSEAATAEAIRMAHLFADTLSGALARRLPHARIEEALAAVLRDLRGAPHLVLRVAPDLVEAASERCTALARARGFEGRLVVLGDPDANPGDARIEWADGGVAIDREEISRRIGTAVDELSAAIAPQRTTEDPS